MAMYDCIEDLSHDRPAFLFRQSDVSAQVIEQLALLTKLEHQEDVGGTLEVFDQVNDVRVTAD